MPEAVRLVANDDEWSEFLAWQAQPKPIMLDRNGQCLDVPHELADDLFGRLITQLKAGEISAVGFRDGQIEPNEVPSIFWSTHWYNIWFNLLVDLGHGAVVFSSICVGDPVLPVTIAPTPTLRSAMKAEVTAWVGTNPGTQIRKKDLQKAVLEKLAERFPANTFSENMFKQLWKDVPPANKFTSNPAWVAGKGGGKS